MVLSDVTIARYLAEGRLEIDPYDDSLLQPSSVDVRVDRLFRVFRNNRYPYIDVKPEQDELTELVEVDGDHAVRPPPRRVRARLDARAGRLPDDLVARLEGKCSLGRLGLLIHSTAGFVDAGLGRARDARALERRQPADHDLPRDEDRPDLLHADDEPAATPYGSEAIGSKYKGQRGPTASRYWKNFE